MTWTFDCIRNLVECLLTDLTERKVTREMAGLSSDRTLRLQFNGISLLYFWITVQRQLQENHSEVTCNAHIRA